MDAPKTSISAGIIIGKLLSEAPAVAGITDKVFPVAVDQATLPYIVFKTIGLEQAPVKGGQGADTAELEVCCCAEGYEEAVTLAEAVREALDGISCEEEGIRMRSCRLSDHEEFWEDDAYVERLVFDVKI